MASTPKGEPLAASAAAKGAVFPFSCLARLFFCRYVLMHRRKNRHHLVLQMIWHPVLIPGAVHVFGYRIELRIVNAHAGVSGLHIPPCVLVWTTGRRTEHFDQVTLETSHTGGVQLGELEIDARVGNHNSHEVVNNFADALVAAEGLVKFVPRLCNPCA